MKFDFCIGNPPYQEDTIGDNKTFAPPVYHHFYNAACKIAKKVELITPARFLFNQGATPKAWNDKMLHDEHFKVLEYKADSTEVFKNANITGGVAVTYYDEEKSFGAIDVFTPYEELNSIKNKVEKFKEESLMNIVTNRGLYRWSDQAYKEQPEEMKKTSDRRVAPNVFERMTTIFTTDKPNDGHEYIQILGNIKNNRMYKWVRKDYISDVENFYKYKVLVPKANGSGAIGEVLSTTLIGTPLIGMPFTGFTETYISIGATDSEDEANAILKYIKSKFARTMLGILKITQGNAKHVWKYIPLQDFTSQSDIDWNKSIPEIDKQLYKKYELSQEEIDFIETHVKEMV